MASSDVEVVRGLYAGGPVNLAEIFANESAIKAWRSRIESVIHPEFEGGNPAPEAKVMGPLGGLDAFIDAWRGRLGAWESWWFEVEDFVPGSEGNVVVMLSIRARSKQDRVDIPIQGANVVTVKDGKVSRLHLYFDRNAALKTLGSPRRGEAGRGRFRFRVKAGARRFPVNKPVANAQDNERQRCAG